MLHKYEFAIDYIFDVFECPDCQSGDLWSVEPHGCTSKGDYFERVVVDCGGCEKRLTLTVEDWYRETDTYRPRPELGDVLDARPSPLMTPVDESG